MSISIAQSANKQEPPQKNAGSDKSARTSTTFVAKAVPFALIAGFFAVCFLFVSPQGQFPLNDDWIYAEAVKTYLATGHFVLYGNCCAACPVHILLGAFVSKVVGFSHEALRTTDLLLGFAATICLYLALLELEIDRKLATLAALVYCSNPIFLNIYFSYMTDGPSAAFACMYMYGVVRGIKRRSSIAMALGGCALALAVATRQTYAAFIAVNCLVLLIALLKKDKQVWANTFWLVVVPALAFFAADHVLTVSKTDKAYDWYKRSSTGILGTLVAKPVKGWTKLMVLAATTGLYMGLFQIPIIVPFFARINKWIKDRANLAWLSLASVFVTASLWNLIKVGHKLMPFSQNLLRISSLGPMSIMGINFLDITQGEKVWLTIVSTAFGIAFMVLMLAAVSGSLKDMARRLRQHEDQADDSVDQSGQGSEPAARAVFFCVLCACVSIALVVLQTWVTNLDRYYLVTLAPCIVAVVLAMKQMQLKSILAIQIPVLLLIAGYSLAAQQDYMGWNRARWSALHALEAKGVRPREVDGGSEYFFVHEPTRENLLYRGPAPRNRWRWWPITTEKYIVSFSPIPGYEQVDKASYWSALSQSYRDVLVLQSTEKESE